MSQTKAELVNGLNINAALADAVTVDSSGRLLLGTTTEGHASADDLTVANSGSGGITIRSGTSNDGNLWFSDGTRRCKMNIVDMYNMNKFVMISLILEQ